ncbi:MAG: DUF2142 domain-containing protein, partial [Conexibacter sp.]
MAQRLREPDRRIRDERTAAAPGRRALLVLACAAAGLAIALVVTLSRGGEHRSGTNGVWALTALAEVPTGSSICQGRELLPAGTAAIRIIVGAPGDFGPPLTVTVERHGRKLIGTRVAAGWRGLNAIARITPPSRDLDNVEVCFTPRDGGMVTAVGGPTPLDSAQARGDGTVLSGSVPIDYLRAGEQSWWSAVPTVARRIGLGRGSWGGGWVAWAIAALMLASVALAARLVLRTVVGDRDAGSVRAAALAVLAVGALNAIAWSLITPAFQVPDEQTHIAYVQQIGETGRPPVDEPTTKESPELLALMGTTRFGGPGRRTYAASVWSPLQQTRLERELDAGLARHGNDDAGPSTPEPPLYYAAEAIPYRLAHGATLLDRMALMRLLSALLAGITALFAFLFVRECLPARPWAWTVGGLSVAFVPMLGFISGGVNPDALLFPIAAALFYCVACAFRRGMTTRLAVWAGIVLGVGIVAKINFYGLVPGALIALALASRTSDGRFDRDSARFVGIVVGIAIAPYALLTLLDALVWDRTFILARTPAENPQESGLGAQLSHLWQAFLPPLPGQEQAFPEDQETYVGYELWFKGFVGRFGWVIVTFPAWVYRVAAVVFGAVVVLAVGTCLGAREEVRPRRAELLSYGLMAGGLVLLIGMAAARGFTPGLAAAAQGRYLL